MEQQQLPNSTLILILGIASIPLCCCYGVGVIPAIVAIVMSKSATQTYLENPELYKGYKNVTTGKTLAIIGIVLCVISIVLTVLSLVGAFGLDEWQQQMMEQYGQQY